MKKLLLVSLFAVSSFSAFANDTTTITGGASAKLTAISTAAAANGCSLLSAAVSINSSVGNDGTVDCDTVASNIGVAFGNINGKFNVYSAGSGGGSITTNPVADAAAIPAKTAADAALRSSGS